MATKKKQEEKFPSSLYVKIDNDGNDVYYIPETELDNFENDEIVGIYEFKSQGKIEKQVQIHLK
jgi:hypothetical protein